MVIVEIYKVEAASLIEYPLDSKLSTCISGCETSNFGVNSPIGFVMKNQYEISTQKFQIIVVDKGWTKGGQRDFSWFY